MAREILFKAKRKDNGEWIYGNYAFDDTKEERHFIFQNFGFEYEVDKDTICQYTGLTDKNGRKIFENDVVTEGCNGLIGRVVWDIPTASFKLENFGEGYAIEDAHIEWEVIGNIFDNPELLGGGE